MEPLSRNKRRAYLVLFSLLFIVLTPILIFYATGYRVTDSFTIRHTGGLYVATNQSGTKVYVNNELVKESSVFQKNVLIQNLKPGSFSIWTEKEGLVSWNKRLNVYPETVTEARSFMLPITPEIHAVLPFLDADGVGTSTASDALKNKYQKNPELAEVAEVFAPSKNATTTDTKTLAKLSLKKIQGVVHAQWTGEDDERPSYFCDNGACSHDIVLRTPSAVRSFDFFPGRSDLVVVAIDSGISVIEIDDRSEQNIQPLMLGENLDLRVKDNIIYIKKGTGYYSVSL